MSNKLLSKKEKLLNSLNLIQSQLEIKMLPRLLVLEDYKGEYITDGLITVLVDEEEKITFLFSSGSYVITSDEGTMKLYITRDVDFEQVVEDIKTL